MAFTKPFSTPTKARKLLALLMAILCLPVLSAQASPTSDALVIGIQSSKTTSLNPLFPVERDMLSIFDLMYDSLITIDDNYQRRPVWRKAGRRPATAAHGRSRCGRACCSPTGRK